ncbi:MAG: HEAT repeat domain-containing protein [Dehalococcoidia bacterium]
MARRSYKSDDSFLEKLVIGATGTNKVISDLRNQGYQAIELERGSTGFTIWKTIKIKRVRVPDILCVDTGTRVESRAKTTLAISMSHSSADESRGWDFGLNDSDYVALVVCTRIGDRPVDWAAEDLVQYVKVSGLRTAFRTGKVIMEKPKGAQEGFESRVTWPAAVASNDGIVSSITSDRIQFKRLSDNRTISLNLRRNGITLEPLVDIGETVRKNTILASVVEATSILPKAHQVESEFYLKQLYSSSLADRYCAAKAFSTIPVADLPKELLNKLLDESEHIYVRLEIAANLARAGDAEGIKFIRNLLSDSYLEHRLEAVIILGEIKNEEACDLLREVLKDNTQNHEIRAGAAWSLGELNNSDCIPDLIGSFLAFHPNIQIEAARALAKLCGEHTPQVLQSFLEASEEERPGIAWALSKHGKWDLNDLLSHTPQDNNDARHWASYIIGSNDKQRIISDIEKLMQLDPEMYFAVTLLWKLTSSWIYGLEEY